MEHLSDYLHVQSIARATMNDLQTFIREGITERDIAGRAEDFMRNRGIETIWYYGIGAFVHVGKRTLISESGRSYEPSDSAVGRDDIVTVDLSPEYRTYWGDHARTFVVRDGRVMEERELRVCDSDFAGGVRMGIALHEAFIDYAKPDKTFEQAYQYSNEMLRRHGYENLDFAGNVGHTIAFHRDDRKYFEQGNTMKLGEARLFTFEPHISRKHGEYGFKREDIYYFDNGKLACL
ncbi:M24 family metallopeptidase [Paenibacillus lignilyticus]|nr:M24 family metallopeptidase [Paenibacillus lignilyticus]